MCCENYWKRIVPFAIALTIGVLLTGVFQKFLLLNENLVAPVSVSGRGNGIGAGNGYDGGGGKAMDLSGSGTSPLQITSRPRPDYTDAARRNQITGVVRLRVTFLASGEIGSVTPVSGLPNGLTEKAMAAALNIRFEPATVNGQPVTVTKIIEYSFSIY